MDGRCMDESSSSRTSSTAMIVSGDGATSISSQQCLNNKNSNNYDTTTQDLHGGGSGGGGGGCRTCLKSIATMSVGLFSVCEDFDGLTLADMLKLCCDIEVSQIPCFTHRTLCAFFYKLPRVCLCLCIWM